MQDPAALQRAQFGRGQAEVHRVVRQEMARGRLKNCERPGCDEQNRREYEQRPAVADRRFEKAAITMCQNNSLSGRTPARSK